MLSKLAIRRLTKLADHMDALPREANQHFSMEAWFRHHGEHRISSPAKALASFDCGTAACAAGWACTVPSFKHAGLKLEKDARGFVSITYQGNSTIQFGALKLFFDIDYDSATYLFDAIRWIKTPKQWARHCRQFIKANS